MNKPIPQIDPDDDIGPLDEHGRQIWSPEEEEAMARAHRDPEFWAGLERARQDIAAGRIYTTEEVKTHMAELRRRYMAEHGL